MTFTLTINCDGDWVDDMNLSVSELLAKVAKRIGEYECGIENPMLIRDINGNTIGECHYDIHDGLTIDDAA